MNLTDLQFGSHDVYQLTPKQSIIARKFVVYEEVEEECDETSGISTLTFLNFVLASLSIAASVSSNTNSNANANNANNNNNNLNDNNVNIGNNNNNVNSENMLTFQPMVGKRRRRYLKQDLDPICAFQNYPDWASNTAFFAFEFFARLESCKKLEHQKGLIYRTKHEYTFCVKQNILHEANRIRLIENNEEKELASHLFCGTIRQLLPTKRYKTPSCD